MTTLSDGALRRSAWAGWWFVAAMIIVVVPLAVVGKPLATDEPSWGAGGLVGDAAFALVVATFPLVGLMVLRLQPRNTIGWLLMGIGLLWGLGLLADSYATYGLLVSPGSVPGPVVVAALNEGIWVPGIGLTGTFLILLYPNGHLPTPRWRPVAWLSAGTIVALTLAIDFLPGRLEESPVPDLANPLGWEAGRPVLTVLLTIFLPLLPLCIVACAVAVVRRFRRSEGIERLQLKWLATAGALVAATYLVTMASTALTETAPGVTTGWVAVLQTVSLLSLGLLPIAIGIAILRHGLYEIDIVINRALVYGSLTATLASVYLGSILLLQLALNPLTNESDIAVAGSTMAVAAVFRPARARIQSTVDRRFYRSRYDAVRTVDAFAARLRSELDLEAVGADLRGAVQETVQPAHVSLWLRPEAGTQ
ncbi:MAG: hypothetical protein WKF54_10105 [Nocardioidaceae bacterium]